VEISLQFHRYVIPAGLETEFHASSVNSSSSQVLGLMELSFHTEDATFLV
jgi:hypothetical protein